MSQPPNSSDQINQFSPSLPEVSTLHRQQFARLQESLRRVAQGLQDPEDPPANEDPKERLERLEREALKVNEELTEARVNAERMEVLALLAKLDLPALKALKGQLAKLISSSSSS